MGPLCSVQHAPAVAEGPLRLSVRPDSGRGRGRRGGGAPASIAIFLEAFRGVLTPTCAGWMAALRQPGALEAAAATGLPVCLMHMLPCPHSGTLAALCNLAIFLFRTH